MRTKFVIAALMSLSFFISAANAQVERRTWTDVSGKYSLKATFVSFERGTVKLKDTDGVVVALPIAKLSEKDQQYVRSLAEQQKRNQLAARAQSTEIATTDTNWPWWRGPNFNNIAVDGQEVPVEWTETRNVAWNAQVPGRGHSSPIVIGQRVILTTADEQRQTQSVLCFDRSTGKQLWETIVNQGGFAPQIHAKNTHATPTPASDGQFVYAVFNNHNGAQLTALTLDGKQMWQVMASPYRPQKYKFGYAPSPLLYKQTIIVASEAEQDGSIAAFAKQNGRQVWRLQRPKMNSFSSPIVASVGGHDQLLISGCDLVSSIDPNSGRALWSSKGTTAATCGTMVWDGDLVFASGGYPNKETVAMKADRSGQVVWRNREKCYEQSMLTYDGHVYAVNDNGIAFCWDAKTGTEKWKTRLSGPVSSSPILASGNIYVSNERGRTYVFRATSNEYQEVAQNQLGNEAFATPAICGNQIFVRVADKSNGRRQETLYCIAY